MKKSDLRAQFEKQMHKIDDSWKEALEYFQRGELTLTSAWLTALAMDTEKARVIVEELQGCAKDALLPVSTKTYKAKDALIFLGITYPTLMKYIKNGDLKAQKNGSRWAFKGSEILKTLQNMRKREAI